MENKKILITGGFGFIGRHLAKSLLENNYEVTIIDNLYHGQKIEEIPFINKVKFINGDIRDKKIVDDACKNIDIIFHLAALSNIRDSLEDPQYCFSTNAMGTFNILSSAVKNNVKKIIFSSSREIYGNSPTPAKEESPLNPTNIYGVSKVCGEDLCNLFRKNHGLNTTIFRISNVYGPDDPGKRRVIPSFIRNIKNGNDIIINGGDQIIDFVWIEDVIKILLESINKYDGNTLNIGSGHGTTLNELVKLLISLTESKTNIKYNPKISQEVDKFIADISKININPLPLREGLIKLLDNNSY